MKDFLDTLILIAFILFLAVTIIGFNKQMRDKNSKREKEKNGTSNRDRG